MNPGKVTARTGDSLRSKANIPTMRAGQFHLSTLHLTIQEQKRNVRAYISRQHSSSVTTRKRVEAGAKEICPSIKISECKLTVRAQAERSREQAGAICVRVQGFE